MFEGLVERFEAAADYRFDLTRRTFFEARGAVRRAISVIKKRTGKHEDTIREFWIDGGLHVGEPLVEFHGVLRGTPVLHSDNAPARPGIVGKQDAVGRPLVGGR